VNPSVLFLCVHNAGRSQMAAGWMRHLAGDRVDVFSGGSEPAAELNQAVVAAMAEKAIDISGELPQPWADQIVRAADVIVTMGCGDACPFYPGKRYIDWELVDPAGKPIEEVRPIRDDLEQRVRGLLAELGVEPRSGAQGRPYGERRDARQGLRSGSCVTEVHELPDRVFGGGLIDDLVLHVVLDADLSGKAQVGAIESKELRGRAVDPVQALDHPVARQVPVAAEGHDAGTVVGAGAVLPCLDVSTDQP
jgi:arsenate reductase